MHTADFFSVHNTVQLCVVSDSYQSDTTDRSFACMQQKPRHCAGSQHLVPCICSLLCLESVVRLTCSLFWGIVWPSSAWGLSQCVVLS
jgi:hypothetical protein